MKIKYFLKRFFEGILMGLANIIPGVSGGTIALIVGIYERLIRSINSIPLKAPISLIKGDFRKFKNDIKSIDYTFLTPLLVGIAIATLILARFMEYLIDIHAAIAYSFFFGLILASAGTIFIRLDKIDLRIVLSAVIGFIFAFMTVDLPPIQTNHTLPVIFVSGAIAIVSMILPGISGSFILLYLGQYHYMLNALNNFNLIILIVFMIGAIIGLFSFTKGLEYLMKEHKSGTLAFLFGLMLGALRITVVEVSQESPPLINVIIPVMIGVVLVVILEYKYQKLED